MKKALLIAISGLLLTSNIAWATEPEAANIMYVEKVTWQPNIELIGESKVLKAIVDFRYVGEEEVSLGYDYRFDVTCQIQKRKRGGMKYMYYETRDLTSVSDDPVVREKTFSVPFTFTFEPHEFAAAKKRGVQCYLPNYREEIVETKYENESDSYSVRFKPRGDVWKRQ